MKAFETVHLLLIAALLFGVPVAATSRPPGTPFSLQRALTQAAVTAGIVLALGALNFLAARWFARRQSERKSHDQIP